MVVIIASYNQMELYMHLLIFYIVPNSLILFNLHVIIYIYFYYFTVIFTFQQYFNHFLKYKLVFYYLFILCFNIDYFINYLIIIQILVQFYDYIIKVNNLLSQSFSVQNSSEKIKIQHKYKNLLKFKLFSYQIL